MASMAYLWPCSPESARSPAAWRAIGSGDRFDDQTGQGPLQGWAGDPRVDRLDEGCGGGDHAQVVGVDEPAGDGALT
jgi:hypothetical protein